MARDKQAVAEREDEDLITVTMTEPQYHADFGRLEPGDEVDMEPRMARRWVGLHLAEADGLTYEEAKVVGRVRKIHPYVEPEASGPTMNPQVAVLQQQVAELTRLVRSQLGGDTEPEERPEPAAPVRSAARARQPKGAVEVPNPVEPKAPPATTGPDIEPPANTEMTTDSKTFSEAAADAKADKADGDKPKE
jgi:hypothetical protein